MMPGPGKTPADAEPDLAVFGGVAPGQAVLDLASGRGRYAPCMLAAGARLVLLDRSETALHEIDPGVRKRLLLAAAADGAALPFAASTFDTVLFRAAVHHIVDPVPVLREAARVTKPGGVVLLVDKTAQEDMADHAVRNAVERLRHRGHVWAYSERELYNLAGAARLKVEAIESWVETKDAEEWIASGTCEPPWDGRVREYLRADLAAKGRALGTRLTPDGRTVLEIPWSALLLRKSGARP